MIRTRLTALLAVFLVAMAALVIAGCGGSDDDTTSASGGGEGGGETLTVGSDIPYPPFEEGKAPNYKGFDIELMEAIGENIGREVEFQDTSFDTIFRDLAQGKFDAVASASTITDEREKTVDFTNPYYLSEQAILVEEGSDIVSLEDLAGTKVGVQQGTTGEEYSEANAEADEVRTYPSGPDAVNALKSGVVDAVMIDIPVAENAVNAGGGIEISAAIPTEEEYGFAVAQGETELLDELNEGLAQAIEDGTYAKIYKMWFHREPPAAIESATHEAS
ncbi:MAG TPA: basic amino acid ABC transporter substrate-binding protein [Solirubrobacterales bacterium]|nr:basic amino acid ABC transporter substrate-binding protein [Solirubrobacterales bacterium]